MIRSVLALLSLPTFLAAGGWEEFEQRCLLPFEQVRDAVTDGLTVTMWNEVRDGQMVGLKAPDGSFAMTWSDPDAYGNVTCSIDHLSKADAAIAQDAFAKWAVSQIGGGRYEIVDGHDAGLTLRSIEWREPKIAVWVSLTDETPNRFLSVWETGLES